METIQATPEEQHPLCLLRLVLLQLGHLLGLQLKYIYLCIFMGFF